MKYIQQFGVNAIESTVAEGDDKGRPYAVVDVIPHTSSYSSGWRYFADPSRRVMRIRYTDIGVHAYMRFFISDWKALYRELAEMAGARWCCPRCMMALQQMWDGESAVDGELYLEADLLPGAGDWDSVAREIVEAVSPIMLKMSLMGNDPLRINMEIDPEWTNVKSWR